ncbi:TetR family transcriptional regulator [Kribbella voronezhensis]|uniref:TetR family transcriptional regulator n=1 Tax=Kribbella voronezhensis TaxID=2512212 RepID=A0A4R7T6X9_9ACTN|nr:TetR/AcrR family transcriptional regulator [Kribbella voronezhensis]TDU86858.1 TetR family transcriptional regulator [Kribbella voronezhensis]
MPVAKGSSLDPARTRADMLRAATLVFYQRGLDGVGIAELCASVGASKETLYRHFGSKDGLIEAVLQARSDRVNAWIRAAAEGAGDDAVAQLTAVFGVLGQWYSEPDFRGCAIVNAATQRHVEPARTIVSRHLDRYLELFTEIATTAGVADPVRVGRQLLMLLEGATVLADHHGLGRAAAEDALAAALPLLQS